MECMYNVHYGGWVEEKSINTAYAFPYVGSYDRMVIIKVKRVVKGHIGKLLKSK